MHRTVRAMITAVLTIPAVLVAVAVPAAAHIDASATAAGDRTMVRLTMEHGCTEEGATGLRVQLPEGSTQVSATDPAGWTSVVSATEIAWSGGPQPPHDAISFDFMIRLAQPAGTTVRFPAIEACVGSEIAWIEQTVDGQPEPKHPAPSIIVGGTSDTTMDMAMDMASDDEMNTTATMAPEETPITAEGSATNDSGLVVLLVVMAIIIGGAVILFVRNRRPGSPA